jgi:hypothetical protein
MIASAAHRHRGDRARDVPRETTPFSAALAGREAGRLLKYVSAARERRQRFQDYIWYGTPENTGELQVSLATFCVSFP